MGNKSQDHQGREKDSHLKPIKNNQDQSAVHEQTSPAADAQRAIMAPGELTPKRVLALQRTVGNRVVQRIVAERAEPGVLQRHVPPETDEAFTANFPAMQQTLSAMPDQVDALRDSRNALRDQHNAILTGAYAANDYRCETEGESASSQEEGSGEHQEEIVVPATGGF